MELWHEVGRASPSNLKSNLPNPGKISQNIQFARPRISRRCGNGRAWNFHGPESCIRWKPARTRDTESFWIRLSRTSTLNWQSSNFAEPPIADEIAAFSAQICR